MGRGAVDVKQAIAHQDSPQTFAIVPFHISKWLALACLSGVVLSLLLFELLNTSGSGNSTPNYSAILIALISTIGIFVPFIWFLNRQAKKIGPLFIYEKQTGSIVLPKQNLVFDRKQILFVQIITGYEGNNRAGMEYTEVNLVTKVDGKRMRWPVVGRIVNYGKVKGVFRKMIAETDLPVMRYRQKWKNEAMSIEITDMRESKVNWWST